MAVAEGIRPFQGGMRSPIVAPLTRGLIAFPLFFLTTHTDRYFAWTIEPPLTAAVLGANYLASTFLAVVAARKSTWAHGRISISVALVFAPITTAATFIHLDNFHLDTFYGWFWVSAYAVYPPMLAVLLLRQLRTPGGDPPGEIPLPAWVRVLLGLQAVLLLPLGVVMFAAPGVADRLWPWELTPLTSRALSAWVLAFGVLAAHAIRENDLDRTHAALATYPVFGALHVIALARFPGDVRWNAAGAWIYTALIATTFLLGLYGWLAGRRRRALAIRAARPPSTPRASA